MSDDKVQYLGDGVYVKTNEGVIKLYTFDGLTVKDIIFLDETVLDSFMSWMERAFNLKITIEKVKGDENGGN